MKFFFTKDKISSYPRLYETSTIRYVPDVISTEKELEIINWLESLDSFRGGTTDSMRYVPREQIWFDKKMRYFGKTWSQKYDRWMPNQYGSFLTKLEETMQTFVPKMDSTQLNSCLINLYRNENDSIRKHCDSPESFGTTPTILVLSIGAPRRIVFSHRHYNPENHRSMRLKKEDPIEITLASRSLLIMSGGSQKYFCHEIPKEKYPCGKRYSLTFREYLD